MLTRTLAIAALLTGAGLMLYLLVTAQWILLGYSFCACALAFGIWLLAG